MIRVRPSPEPASFDERCRQRGMAWLAAHPPPRRPGQRPPPYWSGFRPDLRAAFSDRCGYYAVWIHEGTVDHFESWAGAGGEAKAYEWSNLRYLAHELNSAKKPTWDGRLVDPFEVDDEWFEVLLPSCVLRVAEERVPPDVLPRVKFTVEKLALGHGEAIVRLRRVWLSMFEGGELSLDGLRRMAPLVARAIEVRTAR